MPVQTSYPGVYVEERPAGVHTIVGVSTSVTAFAGDASMGPSGTPIRIRNVRAYHRQFGPPLDAARPMGYVVEHFFANGGSEALIVRVVGAGAGAAKATLQNKTPADTLVLDASSVGDWANSAAASGPGLVATVDYQTSNPDDLFDLVLTQSSIDATTGARIVGAQESFSDLSMSPKHPNYVNTALAASALVDVDPASPAPGGTAKGSSTSASAIAGNTVIGAGNSTLRISLDFGAPVDVQIAQGTYATRAALLTAVQNALSAAGLQTTAITADIDGTSNELVLESQAQGPNSSVVIRAAPNDAAGTLTMGLAFGGKELSGSADIRPTEGSWLFGGGNPGSAVTAADVIPAGGNGGIFALSDLRFPRFNILCLPGFTSNDAQELGRALEYCKEQRAFLIVDTPAGWRTDPPDLRSLPALGEHGAIYYPRIVQSEARPGGARTDLDLPPSGAIAGVYARADASRGVWKAPAGLQDGGLVGFRDLATTTDDDVSGLLNPKGVNVLRSFPAAGIVIWGARTLKGDDAASSEFKYVPVRRLTDYIASSLYIGTGFAVFEPNDPDLWAQLRLTVTTFMRGLFRQGAFQRSPQRTESDSFFVICDETVNTQAEIDRGRVNVVVGFAPLKPAEFVIVTITQISNVEG